MRSGNMVVRARAQAKNDYTEKIKNCIQSICQMSFGNWRKRLAKRTRRAMINDTARKESVIY